MYHYNPTLRNSYSRFTWPNNSSLCFWAVIFPYCEIQHDNVYEPENCKPGGLGNVPSLCWILACSLVKLHCVFVVYGKGWQRAVNHWCLKRTHSSFHWRSLAVHKQHLMAMILMAMIVVCIDEYLWQQLRNLQSHSVKYVSWGAIVIITTHTQEAKRCNTKINLLILTNLLSLWA